MKNFTLLLLLFLPSIVAHSQTQLTVAKDKSGDYKTVQAAIDAIPAANSKPIIIKLKPGIYKERVVISAGKNNISLMAEPGGKTTIIFGSHEGSVLFNGDTLSLADCATFTVLANDFYAENIHFRNEAGPYSGPAVALRCEGTRIGFRNCAVTAFENTINLSGSSSKINFSNCYVEGSNNFIFGPATALFQNSRLHSKRNGCISSAATGAFSQFGFVFLNCVLTGEEKVDRVMLGRPGSPHAKVAFINCQMDKHINSQGWTVQKNTETPTTVNFFEFNNTGAGANNSSRVKWSRQLTQQESTKFTAKNIFGSWTPK